MKIGIFGGCFNPPHNMHKKIAIDLINNNYLDKVAFVPTGNRYNKKDLIDAKYRIDMLKIMCEDNPNLYVSDFELNNSLTYTYETLDYFKCKYPNDTIYFICGSDNLKEFTTWKRYEYILKNYQILVIGRNNDNIDLLLNKMNSKNIILTNIKRQDLSSTMIRSSLKNNMENNNLDKKVYQYIKKNNLYFK